MPKPRPLDLQASPDGTLLPVPVTGAGITAMELAMSGAAEIAQRGRIPCPYAQLFAPVRERGYPGHWADHVHPGHAGARCDMGSALRTGLMPADLVQLTFPALQDLPLFPPLSERSSSELVVAPEVALTKSLPTNGALAAKTYPARCCRPARSAAFSTARRGGGSSKDCNSPSGRTAHSRWAWPFTKPSKSIPGRSSKPAKTWKPPAS